MAITLVQLFDNVFAEHYNELHRFARNEDHLHTAYINVKEHLLKAAIQTGKTITEATTGLINYCKKTIVNVRKSEWKEAKRLCSISEDGYMYQAENELYMMHELQEDTKLTRNLDNFVMTKMWEFLDKYHQPYEIYIFKVYYFSGRRLTYQDISRLHNIKEWAIDKILKGLRKSIRENLINYIRMEEIYNRVKVFIDKGGIPRDMFFVAHELYVDAFPDKAQKLCMGCRGKSIRIMYADFLAFYKINKHRYD